MNVKLLSGHALAIAVSFIGNQYITGQVPLEVTAQQSVHFQVIVSLMTLLARESLFLVTNLTQMSA